MTSISYGDAVTDALDHLDDLGYERAGQADLASHGPMGAETLAVLGHGDAIPAWVDAYRAAMANHDRPSRRFDLDPADKSAWRPALGAIDRVGDWEYLFHRELAQAPWREVLVRWWPRLLPGLMSRLTHGAIRTAHAVRSVAAAGDAPSPQQLTELARGLAYWAARFTPLPGAPRFEGRHDVAVAALPRTPFAPTSAPVGLMHDRLSRLDEQPGYHDALAALRADQAQSLLSDMTAEFAGICLVHTDYSPIPLVHAVTAPAAIRLVMPYLPAELHAPSVVAMWQVHAAMLLIFTGTDHGEQTTRTAAADTDVRSVDELISRAVEHGDEHVLKFTEACLREHALRPDPRYLAAAEAIPGRIPALSPRPAP
ncbi:questin oxidase family protein [Candidatus Frankia alpina]|uniref:questin oxidase family protein n=1 Tax=Candidatus Frankia alpina TaxID=2699483 RepID=UPI0013D78497|nr:questin oxidase family protein [Candidatus Frankia alpina]